MNDHDSETEHYTIGELADAADTTPRTIRYYTAEGLLPPPDTRGRYALYSNEHLWRLRAIARLKEAYLPLQEIRARLTSLSAGDIQALAEAPAAVLSSAAEYVAGVFAARAQPVGRLGETPGGYAAAAADAAPTAPARAAPPVPAQSQGRDLRERGLAVTPEAMARWRRILLTAGVELHVREPLPPDIESRLPRLVAQVCAALGVEPDTSS